VKRTLATIIALALCASAGTARAQMPPTTPAAAPAPQRVLPPNRPISLEVAASGPWRLEPERDLWRRPVQTLRFFGVKPADTVLEVWPGAGWYTAILGPYLKSGGGKLIAATFDPASSAPFVQQSIAAYRKAFVDQPDVFGTITLTGLGDSTGKLAPDESVDVVLTFRNVHNWMAGEWAEKAFADFYRVLKPGGILGIEEHRAEPGGEQDPLARDGYVQEQYVIRLALEAGFELVDTAEINANPRDTKDHPFGVWTLPPVRRTSPMGQAPNPAFDRTKFDRIGESDRMTLKFRKPPPPPAADPAPASRTSP
jgi:predicted methyltransferase